jgi:hypothetical protein
MKKRWRVSPLVAADASGGGLKKVLPASRNKAPQTKQQGEVVLFIY